MNANSSDTFLSLGIGQKIFFNDSQLNIEGELSNTEKSGNIYTSANLHYYDVENRQNGQEEGFDKTLLLPALNARYQFRNSHSLTLNYNVTAEFTDVANLAEGLMIRGYNSLFACCFGHYSGPIATVNFPR